MDSQFTIRSVFSTGGSFGTNSFLHTSAMGEAQKLPSLPFWRLADQARVCQADFVVMLPMSS